MRKNVAIFLLGLSGILLPLTMLGAPEEARLISVGTTHQQTKRESIWLFGGRSVDLPVSLLVHEHTAPFVADLYLSGGKLGAPVAKAIAFRSFGQSPFPGLREGAFSFELPKVENPIEMLLVLHTDASDPKEVQEIASIPLRVYPDTFFAQIREKMDSSSSMQRSITLILFGEIKGLRELLRAKQIPFEEGGMEFPANIPSGVVAVGEVPGDLPLPSAPLSVGSALLVYHPDAASPEKILESVKDGHLAVIVHQAPPTHWADDVSAQQLLFHLIEKTTPPHELNITHRCTDHLGSAQATCRSHQSINSAHRSGSEL